MMDLVYLKMDANRPVLEKLFKMEQGAIKEAARRMCGRFSKDIEWETTSITLKWDQEEQPEEIVIKSWSTVNLSLGGIKISDNHGREIAYIDFLPEQIISTIK